MNCTNKNLQLYLAEPTIAIESSKQASSGDRQSDIAQRACIDDRQCPTAPHPAFQQLRQYVIIRFGRMLIWKLPKGILLSVT